LESVTNHGVTASWKAGDWEKDKAFRTYLVPGPIPSRGLENAAGVCIEASALLCYIGVTQLNGSGSKLLVKPGARVIAVLPRNGLANCGSPNYNETGAHPHEVGVRFCFKYVIYILTLPGRRLDEVLNF
jgi:hypothetical protein